MTQFEKRRLGRGLDALIGESDHEALAETDRDALKQIDVGRIQPGRYQPRKRFDDGSLHELALSIAEYGILQPLVVRPIGDERYEIIAGERRFRAGQQAGLSKVPCVVKHYDDRQALAIALIENLQRSDLNAIEIAEGLQKLVEDFRLTHERVAQLVGRSRSAVSNTLRLLDLNPVVQQALRDGDIEMGHARAMLSLAQHDQAALLREVVAKHMTVRQTEQRVKTLLQEDSALLRPAISQDHDIAAMEARLSEHMATNVQIIHKKKGNGQIVLRYQDLDDLTQLLERWGFKL